VSAPLLACRDLSVGYDQPVLAHVDLAIERGEIVALLGGSGCGKSTLLRAMTGLQAPLAGDVELFGRSLYGLEPDQQRALLRRTGTAFQQDALFSSMTVGENVSLPLRELTDVPHPLADEMMRNRLAMIGLGGLEHRMPSSLSGGQRKRAALARATILDPELVFCDEPSAGLDPSVAAGIDETLLRLRDALGVTLIVVTHEMESIRAIADRAIMFARGGVVAEGTVEALMRRDDDDDVFGFFHRVADPGGAGAHLERAS
jgi:phospholipid/cholesterol/gamma-HCH transport system ATP-binding protein